MTSQGAFEELRKANKSYRVAKRDNDEQAMKDSLARIRDLQVQLQVRMSVFEAGARA